MATHGEILSRGQASRNRHWAGVQARLQVFMLLFLLCAGLGGWAAIRTADTYDYMLARQYLTSSWDEFKDPFARNLHTPDAESRVSVRDGFLDKTAPFARAARAMAWRIGLFAIAFGFLVGLPMFAWRRRRWLNEGVRAGQDRTVRGAELVTAKQLAAMVRLTGRGQPVEIGGVPIPQTEEARHFMFAGATGTGKTTAIWALLDQIEQRGQHAFVHDVDGSYVTRYYRPERGDLILNPFDGRCAYWNPFDDVRSAADADRLAGFIVAKPMAGHGGDDVWYDQARMVASAIIRRLWESGRGTVADLGRALRDMSSDELRELTRGTEASRVFQKDAEKATASVLFCLAEAAKVVGTLKPAPDNGPSISFDDFYDRLASTTGPQPWIFLASRKRNFAAARPLLGCWLDCVVSAILDQSTSTPPRTWLILDELPALPRATGLLTLLPEGRKFGAAVVIAFQAIGQLRETYGPNATGTIVGQTGTQLIMRLGDPESTTWATQLLGRSEIEERRASQSLDTDTITDRGSLSTLRQTKPVVLDSELGQLPPLEGYLRLSGLPLAHVRIDRHHMTRPGIAAALVPLKAVLRTAPTPATSPACSPLGQADVDRTLGGAL